MKTTNNIIHRESLTDKDGTFYNVVIRLNDECKNGHEDFSITADYWYKGDRRTENNCSGGACGDKLAANFKKFEIFNKLHLCDAEGIPMHFFANAHYHLQAGFNNEKDINSPEFKVKFMDYYSIKESEFNLLKTAKSKNHFIILVTGETDIIERYNLMAKEAIKTLESWTGQKFKSTATKSNLIKNDEAVELERNRLKEVYYTTKAIKARNKAKYDLEVVKLEAKANEKINRLKIELNVEKYMLKEGFTNYIYYNHSNTLKFNWKGYEKKITDEQIGMIKNKLKGKRFNGLSFSIDKRNI